MITDQRGNGLAKAHNQARPGRESVDSDSNAIVPRPMAAYLGGQ